MDAKKGGNEVRIGDITIKQDVEGRYCLNDLHKAAGGEDRHKPGNWLQLDQTERLAEEIETSGFPAIKTEAGRYGGTYVCEELVYAYAMWISPTFNLKVIRTFGQLQKQGVVVAEHSAEDFLTNPMKYMRALMDQAEAIAKENTILIRKNVEVTEQREQDCPAVWEAVE